MNCHAEIPVTLMAQFNEFIADNVGLHFPQDRWQDLMRGIGSAARESGASDTQSFIERLMSRPLSRREIEMLASHLTVGETYFFRDEITFAALEEHILRKLIQQRQNGERCLRIWSAGCCTGEEPYSIMILLNRLLPDPGNWRVTLLATDINPRFLERASSGIYGEWSFRATPLHIREQYFTKTAAGRFQIDPRIRNRVTFSYLNLAEDMYPSLLNNTNAMDIIFCRNVLMYFSPKTAGKVISNFHRCLVEGGRLIVSPIEAPQCLSCEFALEHYPGAVFYRKDSNQSHITGSLIPLIRAEETGTAFLSFPDGIRDASIVPLPESDSKTRTIDEITDNVTATLPPGPLEQARVLYDQGCYEEASEKLRIAVQDPGDIEAKMLLARTLANQGRLSEANVWCVKAVAADKLNPASHYLLAVILQEQGQITDAIDALKLALYLDPDFALASFTLGNLMRRQGRHKESERYLHYALKILDGYSQDHRFPEADGITVGRLREIMRLAIDREMAI